MAIQEFLFTFVWYSVEFACYVSIIAYVLYTFGIIKAIRPKNDVPVTLKETLQNTGGFLNTVAQFAAEVKTVLAETRVPPGTGQQVPQIAAPPVVSGPPPK